jgi:hypothetical protein
MVWSASLDRSEVGVDEGLRHRAGRVDLHAPRTRPCPDGPIELARACSIVGRRSFSDLGQTAWEQFIETFHECCQKSSAGVTSPSHHLDVYLRVAGSLDNIAAGDDICCAGMQVANGSPDSAPRIRIRKTTGMAGLFAGTLLLGRQ